LGTLLPRWALLFRRLGTGLRFVFVGPKEIIERVVETLVLLVALLVISRSFVVAHNSIEIVPQDAVTSRAIVTDGNSE
jgi:hypothetical protein